MIIKNLGYFLREALTSLFRNRLLSIATVSTVTICILILGISILISMNTGSVMQKLESDLEIVAYLDKSLSDSQIKDVKEDIEKVDGVKSVKFISKDEAMKRIQKKYAGEDYDLAKTLGNNPMPHAYEVIIENPDSIEMIANQVEKLYGVNKINYGKEVAQRLLKVSKWVQIISVAIIILIIFGTVFLIATTIRLAIFARRKEVYLMKLIGASDWFVRWPFFIEGIIMGGAGALISIALLAVSYGALINNLQDLITFIPLINDPDLLLKFYSYLFVSGITLGVIGTYISLNRFLDA